MRTYLASWPNGTITVLTASSEWELFDTLDQEGDPDSAKIYILPKKFSVVTSVENGRIVYGETQALSNLKRFHFIHTTSEAVFS